MSLSARVVTTGRGYITMENKHSHAVKVDIYSYDSPIAQSANKEIRAAVRLSFFKLIHDINQLMTSCVNYLVNGAHPLALYVMGLFMSCVTILEFLTLHPGLPFPYYATSALISLWGALIDAYVKMTTEEPVIDASVRVEAYSVRMWMSFMGASISALLYNYMSWQYRLVSKIKALRIDVGHELLNNVFLAFMVPSLIIQAVANVFIDQKEVKSKRKHDLTREDLAKQKPVSKNAYYYHAKVQWVFNLLVTAHEKLAPIFTRSYGVVISFCALVAMHQFNLWYNEYRLVGKNFQWDWLVMYGENTQLVVAAAVQVMRSMLDVLFFTQVVGYSASVLPWLALAGIVVFVHRYSHEASLIHATYNANTVAVKSNTIYFGVECVAKVCLKYSPIGIFAYAEDYEPVECEKVAEQQTLSSSSTAKQ